jgi:hypothetical protein
MPLVHSFIISAILLAPVSLFPDSVTRRPGPLGPGGNPLALTDAIRSVSTVAQSASTSSGERQVPQFAPPDTRPPLPNIDGLTPDDVREFLGPPFATQILKDKRLAWSYATPDGVQIVYFKPENATGTTAASPPAAARPAARSTLPPNGCQGLVARGPVATLVVVMPKTPAFVTPQFRQDAVSTFAPHTTLSSLGTSGAWFVVTFQGARGPQSGYVHCSDVTVVD